LDSRPVSSVLEAKNLAFAFISSKPRIAEYNRLTSISVPTGYKNYSDLAIIIFIKGLLMIPSLYPEIAFVLNTYEKIVSFILSFNPKQKISKNSISKLKNRKIVLKQVARSPEA
jgi:hypothetical protein